MNTFTRIKQLQHTMLRTTRSKLFTATALLTATGALSLLALSFLHPAAAQTSEAAILNREGSRQIGTKPCRTCPAATLQTIYAPTIGIPEASGSQIVLNSRSPSPIDVTPTFYTAEGTAITGRAVQLQPAEIRFVTISISDSGRTSRAAPLGRHVHLIHGRRAGSMGTNCAARCR